MGVIDIHGVYLLDSDLSVIKSVKNSDVWRENGFAVIGSNTDHDKAVLEIMTLKPVLVIYEWRIGGLWLMNRLRAAGAECELVILTDYESFGAQREFFMNGGLDYLLKPLDKREAEAALTRLRSRKLQKIGVMDG